MAAVRLVAASYSCPQPLWLQKFRVARPPHAGKILKAVCMIAHSSVTITSYSLILPYLTGLLFSDLFVGRTRDGPELVLAPREDVNIRFLAPSRSIALFLLFFDIVVLFCRKDVPRRVVSNRGQRASLGSNGCQQTSSRHLKRHRLRVCEGEGWSRRHRQVAVVAGTCKIWDGK